MYTQYYGFSQFPFSITPDPKFVYYSRSHHEALAQMLYGIHERKCLMVCVGEVGVGKTTMIYTLMAHLGKDVLAAMVFDTHVDPTSLYKYLFADFGIGEIADSRAQNTIILKKFLNERLDAGQKTLLILDEAHNLSAEIFHEVVHLTNFETRSDKLLQIVLVGQPELKTVLNSMEFRQLKQRINLRTTIQPLDLADTTNYIRHRLQAAGRPQADLFTADALERVHTYSAGLPRMINTLCDNALLLGFSRRQAIIDSELVEATYRDLMDLDDQDEEPATPLPIPKAVASTAAPVPVPTPMVVAATAIVPPPPPPPAISVAPPPAPAPPAVSIAQPIVTPAAASQPSPAPVAPRPVAPAPAAPPPAAREAPPPPPATVEPPESRAEPLADSRPLPQIVAVPPVAQMLPLADGAARELMPTLVQDDPGSRRQYHLLATRLEAISRSSPLRTIAVTSSIPQEGKTITSLNLAFTLAQEPETRVLLMDSDLRQPALHAYLGHRAIAGVSEILQGKMKLDDALHRIQYENLYVLFAGKKPAEPGGLIASAQMASLLEEIRGKFHYAVIDCPPVGPVADTCTLAGMVDGVVLVVRARFTHREVVTQALEDLNHARLLGIVFNNQQVKATKSRYHYGYGYAEPSKSA